MFLSNERFVCSVLIFVSTRKYIKMEKKTAQKGQKKNYVCMVIRQKVSSVDLDMRHIITSTKIWRLLTTFGNFVLFNVRKTLSFDSFFNKGIKSPKQNQKNVNIVFCASNGSYL